MAETTVDILIRANEDISEALDRVRKELERLKGELGKLDLSGLDKKAEVDDLKGAVEGVTKEFDNLGDSVETTNENLAGMEESKSVISSVRDVVGRLSDQFVKLRGIVDEATQFIANEFNKVFGIVDTTVQQLGRTLRNLGIATGAVSGGVITLGTAVNTRLSKQLGENLTLVDASTTSYQDLLKVVQDASREVNASTFETARAQYTALSAAAGDAAAAADVLSEAVRLSVAGVTSVDTAVTALAAVTNSYGTEIITANEANDILFNTVQNGLTNIDELAHSLSAVLPVASTLGVSFEEVSAAVATITSQSVPTATAMTQLQAALSSVLRPSDELTEVFKDLGGAEQAIRDVGIEGVFALLRDVTNDSAGELQELLGSMEAVKGVLNTTVDDGRRFTGFLDDVTTKSGQVEAAIDSVRKQVGRAFEELGNSIGAFNAAVGTAFEGVTRPVITFFTTLINFLTGLVQEFPVLTAFVLGFGVVIGTIVAAIGSLVIALSGFLANALLVGAAFKFLIGDIRFGKTAIGAFFLALQGGLGPLGAVKAALIGMGDGVKGVATLVASTGAAKSIFNLSGVFGRLAVVLGTVVKGFARLVGFLTGPVGIALAATVFIALKLVDVFRDANENVFTLEQSFRKIGFASETAFKAFRKLTDARNEFANSGDFSKRFIEGLDNLIAEIKEGVFSDEQINEILANFERLQSRIQALTDKRGARERELAELQKELDIAVLEDREKGLEAAADAQEDRLKDLAELEKDLAEEVADFKNELAEEALKIQTKLNEIRAEEDPAEARRQEQVRVSKARSDALSALGLSLRANTKEEFDAAKALIEQTSANSDDIESKKERTRILENLAAAEANLALRFEEFGKRQQAALQEGLEVERQKLADINEELNKVKTLLAEVSDEETTVTLQTNVDEIKAEIEGLDKELAKLTQPRVIPIIADVTGQRSGDGVPGFARGGGVPGHGSGDIVPALLEPGEFVVRKSQAQRFSALLSAINKGKIAGFNRGGLVPSSIGAGVVRQNSSSLRIGSEDPLSTARNVVNLTLGDEGPFPLVTNPEIFKDLSNTIYRQQLKKGRRRG